LSWFRFYFKPLCEPLRNPALVQQFNTVCLLLFLGPDWRHVSLKEFMNCERNLATNRQTRMLSDLRAVNCTGKGFSVEEKDRIMLETAKQNLQVYCIIAVCVRYSIRYFNRNKLLAIHVWQNCKQRNKIFTLLIAALLNSYLLAELSRWTYFNYC